MQLCSMQSETNFITIIRGRTTIFYLYHRRTSYNTLFQLLFHVLGLQHAVFSQQNTSPKTNASFHLLQGKITITVPSKLRPDYFTSDLPVTFVQVQHIQFAQASHQVKHVYCLHIC